MRQLSTIFNDVKLTTIGHRTAFDNKHVFEKSLIKSSALQIFIKFRTHFA